MAEDKGKTAVAAGVGITAGALLALLAARPKPVVAAPEGVVSLDDPAMQALISILEHAESLDADVDEVIDAINRIAAALGVEVPIRPENPPDITAFRVLTTALDTPVSLPDRVVPYNMELVVKALHTNRGVIFVAPSRTAVINPNASYWLIANEAIEYKIKNADHIKIASPSFADFGIVGDGVVCTVEQERA